VYSSVYFTFSFIFIVLSIFVVNKRYFYYYCILSRKELITNIAKCLYAVQDTFEEVGSRILEALDS